MSKRSRLWLSTAQNYERAAMNFITASRGYDETADRWEEFGHPDIARAHRLISEIHLQSALDSAEEAERARKNARPFWMRCHEDADVQVAGGRPVAIAATSKHSQTGLSQQERHELDRIEYLR